MSLLVSKNIYIVAAKRTAFGSFGGSLKSKTAVDLGVAATVACGIDPSIIESCIYGNVIASNNDAAYTARHIALRSGCSIETPALTINRLCGSGFETIVGAVKSILLDEHQVVLTGGTEQMSQAPLMVRGDKARFGVPLGHGLTLADALWDGLTDAYAGTPMGVTAENLGAKYGITRAECDAYAVQSQQRYSAALARGVFAAELAPVKITTKQQGGGMAETDFLIDEHHKPDTQLEKIAKLKPVFKKDGTGLVTAATASGICDGAGSIVVASQDAVDRFGLTPLCRIVATSVTGCDPTIMGIGPVSAIRNVLAVADLSLDDMDRVEINEAFAAQVLSCQKELELDGNKLNINGGAIALGHPLGASGSRIAAHLAHDKTSKYSIGSACIGGGQGIAVLFERC
jgi:acetyl-CoA acyltransferase 2